MHVILKHSEYIYVECDLMGIKAREIESAIGFTVKSDQGGFQAYYRCYTAL